MKTDTDESQAGCGSADAACSAGAIVWEWHGNEWRGVLRWQPELTLFIITPNGPERGRMRGAFMNDADERDPNQERVLVWALKTHAELLTAGFVSNYMSHMPNATSAATRHEN